MAAVSGREEDSEGELTRIDTKMKSHIALLLRVSLLTVIAGCATHDVSSRSLKVDSEKAILLGRAKISYHSSGPIGFLSHPNADWFLYQGNRRYAKIRFEPFNASEQSLNGNERIFLMMVEPGMYRVAAFMKGAVTGDASAGFNVPPRALVDLGTLEADVYAGIPQFDFLGGSSGVSGQSYSVRLRHSPSSALNHLRDKHPGVYERYKSQIIRVPLQWP